MIGNFKNLSAAALALAAAALPGIAHAGTATATGTATLTVISQCSVTGATVNLGDYTTNQTWDNVAAAVGRNDAGTYAVGSLGQEYLNYGSVNCEANLPYTLAIAGTGTNSTIKLQIGGKVVAFQPAIKSVGGTVLADSDAGFTGAGAVMSTGTLSGTGTGAAQTLLGSAVFTTAASAFGTTVAVADTLATAGTYSDTLTYTLNF